MVACACFSLAGLLLICFSVEAGAEKLSGTVGGDRYQAIELATFIEKNHVSAKMAAKKQRAMLPPSAVQFDARLMVAPEPGTFSLVYDALGLWGDGELPEVTHSVFVGADNGRVIGAYVSRAAASQLQKLAVGSVVHFYAIHIYNYARGPRLVIVAAQDAGRPGEKFNDA